MRRLQRWVDAAATVVAAAIIGAYMLIVVYNVVSRYLLGGGIQWYMESSQFLNIWAMFIAGVGLCATNGHLRVPLIDELFRGAAKTFVHLLAAVATGAFYLVLAYASYILATRSRQTVSTMAPLKMSYVYWMLPVAAVLSAASVCLEFICSLGCERERDGEAPSA